MDHVIELCNHLFNHRPHNGIGKIQPFVAHFSPHASCIVSRLNAMNHLDHGTRSSALFTKQPPHETLRIGDRVKVRVPRSIFRKHKPLTRSIWSQDTYKVVEIDLSDFPPVYSLENHKKRFYRHELLRLSEHFPLETRGRESKPKILVNDYQLTETKYLRSGQRKTNRAIYSIMKDGKISLCTADELKMYKNVYGPEALLWSSYFNKPPHNKFIV